jgi:type IV secretion system protein VirB6
MNFPLFTFIWTNIAQRIQNSTGQIINALMAWVGMPFQLCVAAYLIIILMIAAWSSDETAHQRFFRQVWLAAVIYTLASNATAFDYYVQGLVNGLTTSITNAIAGIFGGAGGITANSFDNIAVKMFAQGLQVMKQLSWSAPVQSGLLGLAVIAYWFISLAAIFVIFLEFISSAIVTNFVTAFGPLFIALYFFPTTRMFFDGWLRCVVAGMLTQIFTVGWLAMFVTSLQGMMATMQTGITAAAGSSVDDVATQIFTLILAGFLVAIFATMTTISTLMAIRISGGFHAPLGNVTAPAPNSGHTTNHSQQYQTLLSGGSGGDGGGAGSGTNPGGLPPRNYAFQRNVGAAP